MERFYVETHTLLLLNEIMDEEEILFFPVSVLLGGEYGTQAKTSP